MKNPSIQLGVCALLVGLLTSTGWAQSKDMYQAGQARQRAGQYAEARQNFAEALKLATNGASKAAAQIAIGLTYESEKNWALARPEFEKALAIEGITTDQKAQAQGCIGGDYYWEKKYPEARTELEKVLELKNASAAYTVQAQMFIGHSWGNENDKLAEARMAYAKVLDIPGASPAQKVEARMAVVGTLIKMQRYADARAELQAVLETKDLPPVSGARARLLLGRICFLEKNYTAARTELAKAMAIDGITESDKAEARLRIGLCYCAEKDYERAKPELQKVLTMPGVSAKQTHDAMLHLRLGKLIPGGEKVFTVLFIGCSHTDNSNVPLIVEELAASAPAGSPRIIAGRSTRGGHTLKKLWELGSGDDRYGPTPRAMIAAEPWDFVVFQDLFVSSHDELFKFAADFASLIRSQKASPVLYETFTVFKSPYPESLQKWHDEHVALKKELQVPVAPGGYAWIKYLGPSPTSAQRLALYHSDHTHAGNKGAYMLACAVYSAITGLSPVGLTHAIPHFAPNVITKEEAQAFQEAAWQAFQETNPGVKPVQ